MNTEEKKVIEAAVGLWDGDGIVDTNSPEGRLYIATRDYLAAQKKVEEIEPLLKDIYGGLRVDERMTVGLNDKDTIIVDKLNEVIGVVNKLARESGK
jgi:hypothetical protein